MARHRTPRIRAALHESPLAGQIPEDELLRLELIGTTISLPEGATVIRQDSPGRESLVVLDGHLRVSRDGRAVAELTPGDFAGELSLLTGRPRNATVTTADDATVCVLNRREFSAVREQCPALADRMLDVAKLRLEDAGETMAHA